MPTCKLVLRLCLVLLLAFVPGCGSDDPVTPAPPPDKTAPGDVADLTVSSVTDSSATLTWTAPGDNGGDGTAKEYDIRYSTTPISDADFYSATLAANLPAPGPGGSVDTFVVAGLMATTFYYFALKTADEVPNWSGISNAPPRAQTAPRFLSMWGSRGAAPGQLNNPSGLAVDPLTGDILVVEVSNHRYQRFSSAGVFIAEVGSEGTGNGQFSWPTGIALDGAGSVYVTDSEQHRLQKFSNAGAFVTARGGAQGSGNGQFSSPGAVVVDGSSNIFVVDAGNYRVQKFDRNLTYVTKWGSPGSGDSQFDGMSGIAVDHTGDVYVSDWRNHRIQKFDNSGGFLKTWGSQGSGDGEFDGPGGLVVAGDVVFVTDFGNDRVQKFDFEGTFLSKWGSEGPDGGQFNFPIDVALDTSSSIYVLDAGNHRVQVFR